MGRLADLGDGVGRAGGQADRPQRRQVDQVVADVADLRGVEPELREQRPERPTPCRRSPGRRGRSSARRPGGSTTSADRPETIADRLPARLPERERRGRRGRRNASTRRPGRRRRCTPSVRTPSTSTASSSIAAQRAASSAGIAAGRVGRQLASTPRSRRRDRPIRSVTSIRPDQAIAPVDDRQLADLVRLHQLDRVGQHRARRATRYGSARHHLADRPVEVALAALLEQAGEVAVGEDPQQPARRRPRPAPPPTAAAGRRAGRRPRGRSRRRCARRMCRPVRITSSTRISLRPRLPAG